MQFLNFYEEIFKFIYEENILEHKKLRNFLSRFENKFLNFLCKKYFLRIEEIIVLKK